MEAFTGYTRQLATTADHRGIFGCRHVDSHHLSAAVGTDQLCFVIESGAKKRFEILHLTVVCPHLSGLLQGLARILVRLPTIFHRPLRQREAVHPLTAASWPLTAWARGRNRDAHRVQRRFRGVSRKLELSGLSFWLAVTA